MSFTSGARPAYGWPMQENHFKRVSTLVAISLLLATTRVVPAEEQPAPAADAAKAATAPDGMRLVWADEFDRDGAPDPANWNFETGLVRNRELQWYQPENARCENGLLVIEARRERKTNPNHDPNGRDWRRQWAHAEYTSACLITRGKHAWQYGRFEVRAKIDTRPGLWPAFWTLGTAGGWPGGGEIDVMEYYRGLLLANVAWHVRDRPADGPGFREGPAWWDGSRRRIETFDDPRWSEKFHVWRLDWDENDLKIYCDDKLLQHTQIKHTLSRDGKSPFRQPHFLLLNLAVGGTQGGDPSKTEFPARMEVDYVRVYQHERHETPKPAGSSEPAEVRNPSR